MHSTVGIENPNIVPMDFKWKLNRACELRRLTNQRELSELARVSKSSLNRWLQGTSTPDVHEAARLAEVLAVPLDWLAKDDDQLEPPKPVAEQPVWQRTVLEVIEAIGLDEREAIRRLVAGGAAPAREDEDLATDLDNLPPAGFVPIEAPAASRGTRRAKRSG